MKMRDWILAQEREEEWESVLRKSLLCMDCGRAILEGTVLPMEEDGYVGCLCPACVEQRMIPVETME